ncbi:MAG TPA: hypothetical protein VJB65_03240 [Patescibacteria group bacterium]|nr:hypothetical protein [Patescibacteria group bacterium]
MNKKIHSLVLILSAFIIVTGTAVFAQKVSAHTVSTTDQIIECDAHTTQQNTQHDVHNGVVETKEQPQQGAMRCCFKEQAFFISASTYDQQDTDLDSITPFTTFPTKKQLSQNIVPYIPPLSLSPPEQPSIRSIVKRE